MSRPNHDSLDTPFAYENPSPALKVIITPRICRLGGKFLMLLFVLMPFFLAFVPWQQTVKGRGRVIAFDPGQRPQTITSRISGQIVKWYVAETDRVKEGEKLVDIQDNDPDYENNLKRQRDATRIALQALQAQLRQNQEVVGKQVEAMNATVQAKIKQREAADQLVVTAKQKQKAAEADVLYFKDNFASARDLKQNPEGPLFPEIEFKQIEAQYTKAQLSVEQAKAEILGKQAEVASAQAAIEKAKAEGMRAVASAEATVSETRTKIESKKTELQIVENKIERYKARELLSPCDGFVFRIYPGASQEGQFVQQGQELALIVPDTQRRIVELFVDGIDAAFIKKDPLTGKWPLVRLQFEGWPAVQFSGWPRVAVGTFGGQVFRKDPTDTQGKFRILVEPKAYFEDDAWPDAQYLRQGNQAIGWVFLKRVPVWFELWRRLNGFPPVNPPLRATPTEQDSKPAAFP